MSKIKYVTVPEPLFLGGKNHGLKFFNGADGLKITFDADKDHVFVEYKTEQAQIKHYSTIIRSLEAERNQAPAPAHPGKIKAQVSTPQDHVFAEGAGRTRN